jgi:hypothetical protein
MSNVLGAVAEQAEEKEEPNYSSDSDRVEEDESGAQGYWSPR